MRILYHHYLLQHLYRKTAEFIPGTSEKFAISSDSRLDIPSGLYQSDFRVLNSVAPDIKGLMRSPRASTFGRKAPRGLDRQVKQKNGYKVARIWCGTLAVLPRAVVFMLA
jgi:hypothetical protein